MSLKSAIRLLGQQDRVVVWELLVTFPGATEFQLRGSYRGLLYKHDGFEYLATIMRDNDIIAEHRYTTAEEAEEWLRVARPIIEEVK